ncbi:MAG: hypothetical protein U0003_04695 [Vampirovibrionales bacterium]
MLIIFPSAGETRKASDWLHTQSISHAVIPIPNELEYQTGSDVALYLDTMDNMDVPMRLSREQFVVMRVFREFVWLGDVAPLKDAAE